MRLSVALDSNLLLLFIVGSASRGYIIRHKRLKAFDPDDFDLLLGHLAAASILVLTPNTLTETSNLIGHIAEPARKQIFGTLRSLLRRPEAEETYVPSQRVVDGADLPRLGLTDCTLLELCTRGVTLITTDLALYVAAMRRRAPAVNFNHLREMRP